MADTVIEVLVVPGTTAVYAEALPAVAGYSAGSGTATGSPYTPSQVSGYIHEITVSDDLAGRWNFLGGDTNGTRGETTINNLADIAARFAATDPVHVSVTPIQGSVPDSISGTSVEIFIGETHNLSIGVVDSNGDPVDITAMTLELVIEDDLQGDKVNILDADLTKVGNTVSFDIPSAASAVVGDSDWSLRNTADDSVLVYGTWTVKPAAEIDP